MLPEPMCPIPAGTCGHKHRCVGKQSQGRGQPVLSAFLSHPLHPPSALVLRGLPTSPAHFTCSLSLQLFHPHGSGPCHMVPVWQCWPVGCQGATEACQRAGPRTSRASSGSEHLSAFYLFTYSRMKGSIPVPDTSVWEHGNLVTFS